MARRKFIRQIFEDRCKRVATIFRFVTKRIFQRTVAIYNIFEKKSTLETNDASRESMRVAAKRAQVYCFSFKITV